MDIRRLTIDDVCINVNTNYRTFFHLTGWGYFTIDTPDTPVIKPVLVPDTNEMLHLTYNDMFPELCGYHLYHNILSVSVVRDLIKVLKELICIVDMTKTTITNYVQYLILSQDIGAAHEMREVLGTLQGTYTLSQLFYRFRNNPEVFIYNKYFIVSSYDGLQDSRQRVFMFLNRYTHEQLRPDQDKEVSEIYSLVKSAVSSSQLFSTIQRLQNLTCGTPKMILPKVQPRKFN